MERTNTMSSVISTIETDLSTEVTRLTGLLEKAKTTITAQAQTIAGHVSAAASSSNAVSQATATLKAASDKFEAVLTVAPVVGPLVANVVLTNPNTVLNVASLAPTVNAVVVALDAAVHAGEVAPTLLNLNALEAAYAKLMANAGSSNSAAVPTPAHVAAIVSVAQTTSAGVLGSVEIGVETVATDVKTEAEKLVSEVEAGVKDVAEGNVTIGPLRI
jgi:hypothetical protein